MSLSTDRNLTSDVRSLNWTMSQALIIENEGLAIDHSVKGNRLYKHCDGSIRMNPKPPGQVIGELLIRPLIDITYEWSCRTFQMIRWGFSCIDASLSERLSFFPAARAASPENENVILTEIASNDYICTVAQVYDEAARNLIINRDSNILSGSKDNSNPKINYVENGSPIDEGVGEGSSIKDRQAWIEFIKKKYPNAKINHDFGHKCLVENSIDQIMNIKTPNAVKKINLTNAYAELEIYAREDKLAMCIPKIIKLLSEIETNSDTYFFHELNPLPTFLELLISNAGKDYTFFELSSLIEKVNQLSQKMVVRVQNTNEKETFLKWIDVMVMSAEKNAGNKKFLTTTIKTYLAILQTKAGGSITSEQNHELRQIAWRFKMGFMTEEEKAIVEKVLQTTGLKSILRYVYPYLEDLPEDIVKLDKLIKKTFSAFASSETYPYIKYLFALVILFKLKNLVSNIAGNIFSCCVRERNPVNNAEGEQVQPEELINS